MDDSWGSRVPQNVNSTPDGPDLCEHKLAEPLMTAGDNSLEIFLLQHTDYHSSFPMNSLFPWTSCSDSLLQTIFKYVIAKRKIIQWQYWETWEWHWHETAVLLTQKAVSSDSNKIQVKSGDMLYVSIIIQSNVIFGQTSYKYQTKKHRCGNTVIDVLITACSLCLKKKSPLAALWNIFRICLYCINTICSFY